MTINVETARSGPYTGDGSTSPLDYDFKVTDESHIVVTQTVIATGVDTVLSITTHYTVTGVGTDGGGTVVPVSAVPSTVKWTITRSVPRSQTTNLKNLRTLQPEVIEDALDKATQIVQDITVVTGRTITLATTSTLSDITLPELADGYLKWNSGLTALEAVTLGSLGAIQVPGSSTDNAVVRWSGTGGLTLQNSGVTIDDSANIAGVANLNSVAVSTLLNTSNIGSTVQAYDADTLKADTADTLTAHMSMTLQTDSSSSNAVTCDFAGGDCTITLSENITDINFTNLPTNGWVMLRIKQHASGGPYTVTGYDSNVDFAAQTAPTISTTASAVDLFAIYYDGSVAYMVTVAQDLR